MIGLDIGLSSLSPTPEDPAECEDEWFLAVLRTTCPPYETSFMNSMFSGLNRGTAVAFHRTSYLGSVALIQVRRFIGKM